MLPEVVAACRQAATYVATEAQVWRLYEVFPEHLRAAILVGAFMGARDAEACGLMIADLDLMRGIWHPTAQYPAEPLKTEVSKSPVPFGQQLALLLAAYIKATNGLRRGEWLLCNEWGQQLAPWTIQRAMRAARTGHEPGLGREHAKGCTGYLVPGLPACRPTSASTTCATTSPRC